MRLAPLFPLACAAIGLSACLSLGKTSSGSGGAGGSGGATTTATSSSSGVQGCDAQPSCDACTQCAGKGKCATVVSQCLNDAACAGLEQCLGICQNDTDCKTSCVQQNQGGIAGYNAAAGCLYCTECPHACKGFATCN